MGTADEWSGVAQDDNNSLWCAACSSSRRNVLQMPVSLPWSLALLQRRVLGSPAPYGPIFSVSL